MAAPNETTNFERLAQKVEPGSKLLQAWALHGGVSARVTALEILLPDGHMKKLIVRQHGEADRRSNPNIAADEFKLLQTLQSAGIPVPTPYTFDPSGEIFPIPYIVVEFVEGSTEFAPANLRDFIHQFAAQLAKIHRLDSAQYDLSFLPAYPHQVSPRPAVLDDSLEEGQIRHALESVESFHQMNETVLLHGDYWPGNILWKDGRLVAVIDWEDAAIGDPLTDLAISRLDMLWAFGMDAMHSFTRQYQSLMPSLDFTNLPYRDLRAALRPASKIGEWAGSEARERTMREGHRQFTALAFEQLSMM